MYITSIFCLILLCIHNMENSLVYVDWNNSSQAGLSQVLNKDFLLDDLAFFRQLDRFVATTQRLVVAGKMTFNEYISFVRLHGRSSPRGNSVIQDKVH